MKKKFKLFATIASISMSLALMVFGVIAATNVNVTISSNVSYTASGVAFKLYGKSELMASQPTGPATDLTEGAGSSNPADTVITVGVTNAGTDQMTLPEQTFTASSTWVVYTFTVENIGSNVIDAIIVSATASDTNVIASADTPVGNLSAGQKETFRCYFHLENANRSISQNGTSVSIVVGETPTSQSYIAPESLEGYASTTEGNTTTWTKGQESFSVTSSTTDTTVTETNTFTNGDKVTTFTTTYDTSTIQASASQTFSNSLSSNYVVAERTLVSVNITSGDNTSVTIPDWMNITATRDEEEDYFLGTFYNLRNTLQEIVLPNTLKTIGGYTFYSCNQLTSITIPAGVKSIGSSAFLYCYALAEVYNLSSLNITAGESYSANGYAGTYAKVVHTSASEPTRIVESNGVRYYADDIQKVALYPLTNKGTLTSVTLDTDTTEINQYAFDDCSSLTSIEIPVGVTSIGRSAFRGCNNLASVTFEEGSQLGFISLYAFESCRALTSITIPASVTSIGHYAFQNCTSLATVTFEEGSQLESIRDRAFRDCNSLTSISIPAGVTSIGEYAFYRCSSLTSIETPSGVTSIGNYAFSNCTKLSSVTINSETISIGLNSRSSREYLIYHANTIKIKSGLTVTSYVTTNYPNTSTEEIDGVTYNVYSK